MTKASMSLLLIGLLLSACSGAHDAPAQSAAGSGEQAAFTASPSPTATPTPTPTATPTPQPTPEEVAKTYHMNKNYDIVPNDPNGNKKVVLLTFDDGPKDKETNEALIATLAKHNAKAIFFMNGYRIKQKPELVKLVHDSGQIVGNHSWDHIDLKKEANAKVDQQIGDVQQIVKELIGEAPVFFRPPYGSGSDYVRAKAKEEKLLYMTWSNGSLDWEMTNSKNDPNKVVENVLNQLHNGSNILMHELPWTAQALDTLLSKLEEKGYTFVDPRAIEPEMR
ncbi:polysaccharide deacetylase family protein [Paenibacillus athensensis]|uniref:Xylanase deacetylase n=1 Tax=Paenibacillus athensensis TaxID=1967502 RepID=A0A4Y8Q804_9BACL|nr:polysaccharide deacetylase family protein [Paenibacillus athensensis]MCD1260185.1 polysaccharide deacetylase family protein [Paenibacillus athensensis]